MAHFAQIDDNNIVVNILTVPDEQQSRGHEYLANDLQLGGRWIQTSYNGNVRKMFAGIGYIYNEEFDFFLPPKPYPSWELDTYLSGFHLSLDQKIPKVWFGYGMRIFYNGEKKFYQLYS